MAEQEPTIARIIATLEEPVHLDAGLESRIMAAIEELPSPQPRMNVPRAVFSWLRRRRTIRMSPLGGFALAAGLAGLVLLVIRLGAGGATVDPLADAPGDAPRPMQFVLVAPSAASVTLVGDFNDWNLSATPLMQEAGDGMWWVTVRLSPGRYRYAFVVNGTTWRGDPNAPAAEDEFGRPSSVVSIGGA